MVDIAALGPTAMDRKILKYASEHERTVLTHDAKDVAIEGDRAGVIIVPQDGPTLSEVAAAIKRIDRLVRDQKNAVLSASESMQ